MRHYWSASDKYHSCTYLISTYYEGCMKNQNMNKLIPILFGIAFIFTAATVILLCIK